MSDPWTYDSLAPATPARVVRDLIRARELLLDLVWKDLRARYRYAVMGFLWAVLEPLLFMALLAVVFSFILGDRAALTGAGTRPYATQLLCGLVFWQYFSGAVASATHSLVDARHLVKKVRFPREVIPLAACLVPLVNLAIGFALLGATHLLFGGRLSAGYFLIPMVFGIELLLTLGLALWFSCGHALFRDVGNMVAVGLMFGFYASPVIYPADLVSQAQHLPGWLTSLYWLNPMAGLLTACRDLLFDGTLTDVRVLAWPAACAILVFVTGLAVFRKTAATIADSL